MIPVYLCDDEKPLLQMLAEAVRNEILIQNYDMQVVCEAGTPDELLAELAKHTERGIYLLDVDLNVPGSDGFQLGQRIREQDPRGFLIYVTSHEELAFETFRYRLEAMDYIAKGAAEDVAARLRSCFASVVERIRQERSETSKLYTVKVFDEIHHVPLDEILYFETSPQKHRLILHAEGMVLEYFGNLQKIEDSIGNGFWRCHRSYLLNRDHVRKVDGSAMEVELTSGERVPLSRKAKKAMK